jgi:hypothetical protein
MNKKAAPVEITWIDKANLYTTRDGRKIASLSINRIGHVIAWHEFVPTRISQRLSSIWSSSEAAEFVIYAAYAETLEENARKEAKSN